MENPNFVDRRKASRIEIKVPVRFHLSDAGQRGLSVSYNLSRFGIQVLSFDFMPVNKNLITELYLSDIPKKIINMVSRVVWNEQLPYTDRYKVGLEFNYMSDEARKDLTEFLNTQRAS